MDLKLFDSKSVSASASEIIRLGRTNSGFRNLSGSCFSSQFCCSSRGDFSKASYSSTRSNINLSNKHVGSAESSLYNINGSTNGTSMFSRKMRLLDASDDLYDGVVVDPERLPTNCDAFTSMLRFSVSHWKRKGKKGVWLKLPLEQSEFVPIAVKEGFQYHHAEPGYVMLTYWIPEGPSMLPSNATHQVGVGGFVINDKDEVLVVQEKYCTPSCAGLWKLPTGFIVESEEIYEGAVREVKEETGIDTEFVEVIAFRHIQNAAFEKSDLFFICMLRPLSTQIKIDDIEIQAAKWMPFGEFVEQPLIKGDKMFKKIIDICVARLDKRYCGLYPHHVVSKFDGKSSSLYYNVLDPPDFNCIGN